jgi:hypothetical protein
LSCNIQAYYYNTCLLETYIRSVHSYCYFHHTQYPRNSCIQCALIILLPSRQASSKLMYSRRGTTDKRINMKVLVLATPIRLRFSNTYQKEKFKYNVHFIYLMIYIIKIVPQAIKNTFHSKTMISNFRLSD